MKLAAELAESDITAEGGAERHGHVGDDIISHVAAGLAKIVSIETCSEAGSKVVSETTVSDTQQLQQKKETTDSLSRQVKAASVLKEKILIDPTSKTDQGETPCVQQEVEASPAPVKGTEKAKHPGNYKGCLEISEVQKSVTDMGPSSENFWQKPMTRIQAGRHEEAGEESGSSIVEGMTEGRRKRTKKDEGKKKERKKKPDEGVGKELVPLVNRYKPLSSSQVIESYGSDISGGIPTKGETKEVTVNLRRKASLPSEGKKGKNS
nr:PREDICTED: uncharacterized protein LOC106706015 [Latimeria chalumnae]|eukprot:XP_014351813.1 PREDICTED: uncharacterized protein LOC106706015 [Latimeria chalumnae]